MDDRSPRWGDDDEVERRQWADWTERQRTGWGTPSRWMESWLGPVRFRVGAVAIAVVFLVFLAISYVAGGTSVWGGPSANAAIERVSESPVHGLNLAEKTTYGDLLRDYADQNHLGDGEWTADTAASTGYVRVVWRAEGGSAARTVAFQVTDDRERHVRVDRRTIGELEAIVGSSFGDDAAARFRAAAELS